jgi:hypothetical protein
MPLTHSCSPAVEFRQVATTELQAAASGTLNGTRTNDDGLPPRQVGMARPTGPVTDIVEEWGMQSFPASDPPMNW